MRLTRHARHHATTVVDGAVDQLDQIEQVQIGQVLDEFVAAIATRFGTDPTRFDQRVHHLRHESGAGIQLRRELSSADTVTIFTQGDQGTD